MKRPKGFARFITIAASYLKDPDMRLRFISAVTEYAKNKKAFVKGFKYDLMSLIGLIKDWSTGSYTRVSKKTILLAFAALLYFLSPLDTIPDFLGAIGFADDAAVIIFVLNSIREEIDRYRQWKSD
ncbi:MAG: DUF1232 domain-containing protein [Nitrospira sp.]|nr:DUF1232 domain-containing protein [Nitrospira sp.]